MNDYLSGVIEGFYGQPWSWEARHDAVDFLQRERFNTYVYAPKADRQLRRAWREPYPETAFAQLRSLREHCRNAGIRFGIGLSPWGLQSVYEADDWRQLRQKLQQLNELDSDVLCILFDDMPGAIPGLAERQAAIVADIVEVSSARRHIVCPTYYSFDPQLEKLFGAMPPAYLPTLGRNLDPSIDVFWTGPLVLSQGYARDDFAAVGELLGRRPLLWDNYPVNDGRKISRFLYTLPVRDRSWKLREWCRGHLANPMNQARLSQFPLLSLAHSYRAEASYDPDAFCAAELDGWAGTAFAALLRRDMVRFQTLGLDALDVAERDRLVGEYRMIGHPAAMEIVGWLREQYRFDPECLND